MTFSPDGRLLASGEESGIVRVWNAGTGMELQKFSGHTARILALSFSPDGSRLASAGLDGSILI